MSVPCPFCLGHCHLLAGAETDQHGLLGGAMVCWERNDLVQGFSNLNMHANYLHLDKMLILIQLARAGPKILHF